MLMARVQYAWYVWAMRLGRPIMLGGYSTEQEASTDAQRKLDCTFEVVELPTIDSTKAWKILRNRMWKQSDDIENVLQRAKHKVDYQK